VVHLELSKSRMDDDYALRVRALANSLLHLLIALYHEARDDNDETHDHSTRNGVRARSRSIDAGSRYHRPSRSRGTCTDSELIPLAKVS
jgi:hypothetical protein